MIEFLSAKKDGYPDWTEDDEREYNRAVIAFWDALAAAKGARPDELWCYSLAELDALPELPPRCVWFVQCHGCFKQHQRYGWYALSTKDFEGEQFADSLAHLLSTKQWFGPEEACRLYYRYKNAGREQLPHELVAFGE